MGRPASPDDHCLVTTDYVVDKTLTLLRSRGEGQRAIALGEGFFGGQLATVHLLSSDQIAAAWQIFQRFCDKAWSFTDCTSKVVMEDRLPAHVGLKQLDRPGRTGGPVQVTGQGTAPPRLGWQPQSLPGLCRRRGQAFQHRLRLVGHWNLIPRGDVEIEGRGSARQGVTGRLPWMRGHTYASETVSFFVPVEYRRPTIGHGRDGSARDPAGRDGSAGRCRGPAGPRGLLAGISTERPVVPAKFRVQYRCGEDRADTNTDSVPGPDSQRKRADVAMKDLSVSLLVFRRSGKPQNFWCDWAQVGQQHVTGRFVDARQTGPPRRVLSGSDFRRAPREASPPVVPAEKSSAGWPATTGAITARRTTTRSTPTRSNGTISRGLTLYRQEETGVGPGADGGAGVQLTSCGRRKARRANRRDACARLCLAGAAGPARSGLRGSLPRTVEDPPRPAERLLRRGRHPLPLGRDVHHRGPRPRPRNTSEAASYWLWLEAKYGHLTGDWSKLAASWDTIEKHFIPTVQDQPNNAAYNPANPATYAAEYDTPDQYPSKLRVDVPVGQDPLADELRRTYRSPNVYGMHWLVDADNWYGYGRRGDGTSRPAYINTFQRGPMESVWATVPHPSWEAFRWGGRNGFLDLFTGDNNYARQWRYTNAPDADARRGTGDVLGLRVGGPSRNSRTRWRVDKAAKLGDYLRYAMFDKYFMKPGCRRPGENPGRGYESAHYLLSWYYAWGGAIDGGGWAWRIGCSHVHSGYQNPLAAWVLANHGRCGRRRPTRRATGRRASSGSWSSTAGCNRPKERLRAGPPTAGRAATSPRPPTPVRSTAWSTTGSPSITIRPATTGSGCRHGPCAAWRSTTT